MTERPIKILIIDDEDRYAELCHRLLPRYQYITPCQERGCPPCQQEECTRRNAHHWYEAKDLFAQHKKTIDVVLLDLRFDLPRELLLPEGLPESGPALEKARRLQGIEILRRIRKEVGEVPVILMTRHDEIAFEDMADALSAWDYTYLAADEGLNLRALESQISSIVARRSEQNLGSFVWGSSSKMAQLRRSLEFLALGDRPVLILGETGTGKSYFARQVLHPASGRSGPFAQIDLAALPDSLLSSELFGTARGAFSGAVERVGAFEYADGGTLFLDEIGNLPQDAQRRLLTVLQEKEVVRLGENRPKRVDVKVCAATNADIEEAVQRKQFRNDLYMRLNPAARIELPPLRDRREDIEPLCQFLTLKLFKEEANANLLKRYAQQSRLSLTSEGVVLSFRGARQIDRESLCFVIPEKSGHELIEHSWPGNVRQLEMVLANLLLQTLVEALGTPARGAKQVLPVSPRALRDLLHQSELGHKETPAAGGGYAVEVKSSRTLHEAARGWECEVYQRLFQETQGDFSQMALRLLGDSSERSAKRVRLRFNQLGLKARAQ